MKTLRDFIIQSLQDLNVSEAHYDMYEKELFVMDNLSEDKKVKFIQKILGFPHGKIIVGDQYVSPSRYRVAFEFYNENEICFTIYAMDIQDQNNIDLIRSKIADCIAHVR